MELWMEGDREESYKSFFGRSFLFANWVSARKRKSNLLLEWSKRGKQEEKYNGGVEDAVVMMARKALYEIDCFRESSNFQN